MVRNTRLLREEARDMNASLPFTGDIIVTGNGFLGASVWKQECKIDRDNRILCVLCAWPLVSGSQISSK
jgi:hypothetical protein